MTEPLNVVSPVNDAISTYNVVKAETFNIRGNGLARENEKKGGPNTSLELKTEHHKVESEIRNGLEYAF